MSSRISRRIRSGRNPYSSATDGPVTSAVPARRRTTSAHRRRRDGSSTLLPSAGDHRAPATHPTHHLPLTHPVSRTGADRRNCRPAGAFAGWPEREVAVAWPADPAWLTAVTSAHAVAWPAGPAWRADPAWLTAVTWAHAAAEQTEVAWRTQVAGPTQLLPWPPVAEWWTQSSGLAPARPQYRLQHTRRQRRLRHTARATASSRRAT